MMINELTVALSYQEMPFIPPVIFRLSLLYHQVNTEYIIIVLGNHSLTVTLYIKAFMAGVGRGVTPESFQGRCPCSTHLIGGSGTAGTPGPSLFNKTHSLSAASSNLVLSLYNTPAVSLHS